jgi:hypothetical protein
VKGYGKDNNKFKGFGKGYGKDGWYKGKGDFGKGSAPMPRACFGRGSTEHILKDCPKNPMKVQQVTEQEEQALFIGNVRDEWKHIPMKIGVPQGLVKPKAFVSQNRFNVLQVEDDDDEECTMDGSMVFAVQALECDEVPGGGDGQVRAERQRGEGIRGNQPSASTPAEYAQERDVQGRRRGSGLRQWAGRHQGPGAFRAGRCEQGGVLELGLRGHRR